MAGENTPNPMPSPAVQWFRRLGLSGKLLALGGLAGVIVGFLPLISVDIFGKETLIVLDDWRGKFGLVCYIGAVILAVLLYPSGGSPRKGLCWAGMGVGALALLLVIWLLIQALRTSTSFQSFGTKASVGFGSYLNVLTAITVAVGAVLKAREEKVL